MSNSKPVLYTTNKDKVAIQTMPLYYGLVNLTSGTYTGVSLVYCAEDGSIDVTWNEDTSTSETITMSEGESFSLMDVYSVEISDGTFHLA